MPFPGNLPLLVNPLKTTTAEIYEGWQKEAERLQRRLWVLAQEASGEKNEAPLEAEGLRTRLRALHDLLEEASVIDTPPDSWRRTAEVVRPGTLVRLELEDGCRDLVFVGLSGPIAEEDVISPGTPLGAAIIGRHVGETVTYRVEQRDFKAIIHHCLVPGEPVRESSPEHGRLRFVAGADEVAEANQVAFAIDGLLREGLSHEEIAVTWRAPYQGQPLERVLFYGGIPYCLEEREGFFGLPLVTGILGLLRMLADQRDGASHAAVSKTFGGAHDCGLEPWEAGYAEAAALQEEPDAIMAGLGHLRSHPPAEVLAALAKVFGGTRPDDPFRSPWRRLMEDAKPHHSIRGFLAHADEIRAAAGRNTRNGVRMFPLPRLGGRKYGALFLIGANEGALPFCPPGDEEPAISEERALFYAAIAAGERATVSWARTHPRSRLVAEVDLL